MIPNFRQLPNCHPCRPSREVECARNGTPLFQAAFAKYLGDWICRFGSTVCIATASVGSLGVRDGFKVFMEFSYRTGSKLGSRKASDC